MKRKAIDMLLITAHVEKGYWYKKKGFIIIFYWTTVKNPPAVWETWVWSLGWEDPLEKDTATHSSILA